MTLTLPYMVSDVTIIIIVCLKNAQDCCTSTHSIHIHMWFGCQYEFVVSLAVIPEIIFPNDSFTGYVVNVTDPVTFVCTATGIPPPTIQWFRDGVLLSSGVMLSEPSQTMVPAPMGTGTIYQVERTLTFNTTGSDTGTYTCEASNINVVQPTTAQNFTLFVQGRLG